MNTSATGTATAGSPTKIVINDILRISNPTQHKLQLASRNILKTGSFEHDTCQVGFDLHVHSELFAKRLNHQYPGTSLSTTLIIKCSKEGEIDEHQRDCEYSKTGERRSRDWQLLLLSIAGSVR